MRYDWLPLQPPSKPAEGWQVPIILRARNCKTIGEMLDGCVEIFHEVGDD